MADNILANTLTKPAGLSVPAMREYPAAGTPGGASADYNDGIETYRIISDENIRNLSDKQATAEQLSAFQKIMSLGSTQAYKERQANEVSNLNFDPHKVSGGFFKSVITKLEQERGADESKIYGTNVQAYRGVQDEIQKRIEYIQGLEDSWREYNLAYTEKKYQAKKAEVGKSFRLKQLKKEKQEFNRQYINALMKAGSDTGYMDFKPDEIKQSIFAMADRNHSMDAIEEALNMTGIPTFQGSLAANYLSEAFK